MFDGVPRSFCNKYLCELCQVCERFKLLVFNQISCSPVEYQYVVRASRNSGIDDRIT